MDARECRARFSGGGGFFAGWPATTSATTCASGRDHLRLPAARTMDAARHALDEAVARQQQIAALLVQARAAVELDDQQHQGVRGWPTKKRAAHSASQGRRGAARERAAARRVPPGGAGAGRLARRQRARQCSAPRRGGPVACGKASSRSRQQRQQRQQRRWRRDESGDFLAPRSLSARSTQHPHRLSHDSERHAFIIVCSFACPDLPNDYIMKHSVAAGAAASDDDTVRRSGLGESGRRRGLYVYRLAAAASGCSGATLRRLGVGDHGGCKR